MDTKIPKYLLVEDHIRKQIVQGKLTDKLPGERILARDLGYSYMTVRKAIENLVNEGILYKVPTKGTFVVEHGPRKSKTGTIGYFLDSRIAGGLSSPFYGKIFNALEKEFVRQGYSLLYFTDTDQSTEKKFFKKLDGVIASSFPRVEPLIDEFNKFVPVVVIENSVADKTIPSVTIDNFNAIVEVVDYLCSLNHQRIAFMTGLEDADVGKNRFEGYKSGLRKHDIATDTTLVFRGNYTFRSGVSGADYFLSLEPMPSAIICANDSMAMGAINRLYQQNIRVPEDVSIIGFDDIDLASQIIPALSTVSVPYDKIAENALRMLNCLIEDKEMDNRHVALATRLTIRESTAAAKEALATA